MKLLQCAQLGLITLFVQHACIQATINRVIPNMFYQVTGCEGDDLLVECPLGYYIEIAEGRYGRTSATECIPDGEDPVPEDKLTCAGTSVFDIPAVTACNGLETCKLKASVEALELESEPCADSGVSKYLNVSFTCIKPIVETFVCEGDTIIMSCPNGEVIQVVDVLYGRTDKERCTENTELDSENTECYSPDAGWRVTDLCNHKPYCEVQASATMFGDPCEGTSKFLHVVYQCATCNNENGDDEKCDGYALRGECEVNPSWMMASCRKSCWRCDTNAMCSDASDFYECTKWASIGECHNNEDWMKLNCQYSCNRCWESTAQAQEVNDGWQEPQEQQYEEQDQQQVGGQENYEEQQEEQEEKVEVHKRDTRNHSEESEESDGPPLKRYYSLIALGGTVLVMTSMIIYLSMKPKQAKTFKKSA